jgi:hypothetical protein
MKLAVTPLEPLSLQANMFGPDEPVYPTKWREKGAKLKWERQLRGFTLAGAAHRLGLEPEELHRLEAGGYEFDLGLAITLLRGGAL